MSTNSPGLCVPSKGMIDLVLEQRGATTRALRSLALPPLQLSRVRYDDPQHPDRAVFTLLHLGGVLAGDRTCINVALAAGASARVIGAAATQVYTMPSGDAAQALCLRLAARSRLLWLPEPLILFAGARYSQTTQVELAPAALLVLLDICVPGRLARGEVFQFERFESRLEVHDANGKCLVAERSCIEPGRWNPAVPGIFGTTPVLGSLYVLGDSFDAEGLCTSAAESLGGTGGAALLPNGSGLLARVLGATPSAVRARLLDLWRSLGDELDR